MDLVVILQILQQLTTSLTFFQIRYRASLFFYCSSIVLVIVVIIFQENFKLDKALVVTGASNAYS